MKNVQKFIDVDQPISTVYNQWTQFEDFPEFMEGVEEVSQNGDKRLHWVAKIGGKRVEWDAEISDQVPDHHITWRSISGTDNSGTVAFEDLGDQRTRVSLRLSYEPHGAAEALGDALGVVERKIQSDLKRFKEFIEARSTETGAWRGEIRSGEVNSGQTHEINDGDRPTRPEPTAGASSGSGPYPRTSGTRVKVT